MAINTNSLPADFPVETTVLAEPHFAGEALLTADLDLKAIPRARFDFDPVGHYARPDVFRLVVDTTARAAVVEAEERSPASRTDAPA